MANEEVAKIQFENGSEIHVNSEAEENTIDLSPEEQAVEIDEVDQLLRDMNDSEHSPEDVAAAFFQRHVNVLKSLVTSKQLSLRGLRRVFINVALGPYSPTGYNPANEVERKLVYHFQKCVDARQMMQLGVEMARAEQAIKKAKADEEKIKTQNEAMITPEGKEFLENLPEEKK